MTAPRQNSAYRPPLWILPSQPQNLNPSGLNLHPLALRILFQRGYRTKEEILKFLSPKLEDLHSPFLLPDMDKAVERIASAIKRGEKILIYGDYDVDGVTSTSLLWYLLKDLGAKPLFYIPHRIREGYGLSKEGVLYAKEAGISLIITVDCGTTAFEEIKLANQLGISVIVCDHHEPKERLPEAYALINPKRRDSTYPFDGLAGVGVSYKLAWGVIATLGRFPQFLYDHLDLVALGTVADVVPLIDENRILVKYGLMAIKRTKKIGLRALLKVSGLENQDISTYHISFIIGPRINASGRLSDAEKAVKLLITEDEEEAEEIAQKLDKENRERQSIEDSILQSATQIVEKMDLEKKRVIVLGDETWHEGVIGIVASRISERFVRPTILFSLKEDIAKGSGRSIPGFHLYEALKSCQSYLLSFGGHKYAAGVLIERKNLLSFEQAMNDYASSLPEEIYEKKLFADVIASLYDIDERLLKTLAKFEPFGVENPQPVFVSLGLEVVGCPRVVKNSHLKFKVREKERVLPAIAFGRSGEITNLQIGKKGFLDILYQFDENTYLGKTQLELQVKDMRVKRAVSEST